LVKCVYRSDTRITTFDVGSGACVNEYIIHAIDEKEDQNLALDKLNYY